MGMDVWASLGIQALGGIDGAHGSSSWLKKVLLKILRSDKFCRLGR